MYLHDVVKRVIHDEDKLGPTCDELSIAGDVIYKPGPIAGYRPCRYCCPGLEVPSPLPQTFGSFAPPAPSQPQPMNQRRDTQGERLAPLALVPSPTRDGILSDVRELAAREGKEPREVLPDLFEAILETSDVLSVVIETAIVTPASAGIATGDGEDGISGSDREPSENGTESRLQSRAVASAQGSEPGNRGRSDPASRRRSIVAASDDNAGADTEG